MVGKKETLHKYELYYYIDYSAEHSSSIKDSIVIDNKFNFLEYKKGYINKYNIFLREIINIINNNNNFINDNSIITAVPSKPSKINKGNNNEKLINGVCSNIKLTNACNYIVCNQDYASFSRKKLSYSERIKLIKGKFSITDKSIFKDKDVILFDDCVTSGTTILYVAALIEACSPKSIKLLSIARTIKKG